MSGVACSVFFFFSSRRRHTRCLSDWSSDVCSSDLGLGLSVCYGIIADHGARIWAESQPGHGATFTIELPVRVAVAEQLLPTAAQTALPVAPPRGRRILLVEDDSSVVYLVRSLLEHGNMLVI